MGINYYFVPKKIDYEKFKSIRADYQIKLDKLVEEYEKDINDEFKKQIENVEGLFNNCGLKHHDEWYSTPYLEPIDYPEIHICKLSAGWKPCLQKTRFYSNLEELIYFYESYKDKIKLENEYGEECDFNELIQDIKNRSNNKSNKTHSNLDLYSGSYSIDSFGIDWCSTDFS